MDADGHYAQRLPANEAENITVHDELIAMAEKRLAKISGSRRKGKNRVRRLG